MNSLLAKEANPRLHDDVTEQYTNEHSCKHIIKYFTLEWLYSTQPGCSRWKP